MTRNYVSFVIRKTDTIMVIDKFSVCGMINVQHMKELDYYYISMYFRSEDLGYILDSILTLNRKGVMFSELNIEQKR